MFDWSNIQNHKRGDRENVVVDRIKLDLIMMTKISFDLNLHELKIAIESKFYIFTQ